jgi:hypothetical protein
VALPTSEPDDTPDTGQPASFHELDLDVGDNWHSLRFDKATKEIVDWGRRLDLANLDRERAATELGDLAKLANGRGRLDVHVAAAIKVVALAVDVSPQRLRAAVADALETSA